MHSVDNEPVLDFDKLRQENALMGAALTHWISRYYGLMAAFGMMPAEQVLPNVQREAAAINAQLKGE